MASAMWAFCSTKKTVVPAALISRMISKILPHHQRREAERGFVEKE